MRWVLIANADNRRVSMFQSALVARGLRRATVLPWTEVLARPELVATEVTSGAVLRLDSPGEDPDVLAALWRVGHGAALPPHARRIDPSSAHRMARDRGRFVGEAQRAAGFERALSAMGHALERARLARVLNPPLDVATMCDKRACASRLAGAGVPTCPTIEPVSSTDELIGAMRRRGWRRVFVKPRWGSSAFGVVALETDGRRLQAHSTLELAPVGAELRLYCSLRVRTYRRLEEVRALVDAVLAEGGHVERWVPKASVDGRPFDARVLVIGGRARHVVVRVSAGPITNLHLGNRRGDLASARRALGAGRWEEMLITCERAAACFPASHQVAADVMFAVGGRSHFILELNAFGDLLPGVLHEGMDSYGAQVDELEREELRPCAT